MRGAVAESCALRPRLLYGNMHVKSFDVVAVPAGDIKAGQCAVKPVRDSQMDAAGEPSVLFPSSGSVQPHPAMHTSRRWCGILAPGPQGTESLDLAAVPLALQGATSIPLRLSRTVQSWTSSCRPMLRGKVTAPALPQGRPMIVPHLPARHAGAALSWGASGPWRPER